jgi:hypothetical protein
MTTLSMLVPPQQGVDASREYTGMGSVVISNPGHPPGCSQGAPGQWGVLAFAVRRASLETSATTYETEAPEALTPPGR